MGFFWLKFPFNYLLFPKPLHISRYSISFQLWVYKRAYQIRERKGKAVNKSF